MSKWPDLVLEWRDTWQSLDGQRIINLYSDDAAHMSSIVVERIGLTTGALKSRAAMGVYIDAVVKHIKSFEIEIIDVIARENGNRFKASVEYWRKVDEDGPKRHVVEIIEWYNGKITASCVFHF